MALLRRTFSSGPTTSEILQVSVYKQANIASNTVLIVTLAPNRNTNTLPGTVEKLRDTAGKGPHNYAFEGGAIGKVTINEVQAALNAQFRATGKGQVPAYEIREIRQKASGSANQQPETSIYTNHNVTVPLTAVMSSIHASALLSVVNVSSIWYPCGIDIQVNLNVIHWIGSDARVPGYATRSLSCVEAKYGSVGLLLPLLYPDQG